MAIRCLHLLSELRWGGLLVWFLAFSSLAQTPDPLLDFSAVMPPASDQLKRAQPMVNWLVRADAAVFCEKIPDQDGSAVWREGCVAWSLSKSTCTLVTTHNTTHSVLGQLFLLCLRAGESS